MTASFFRGLDIRPSGGRAGVDDLNRAEIGWGGPAGAPETDPERFAQVACFGSIKDDLIARLTGRRVVDRSVATASGLFDLFANTWDDEIIGAIGVRRDQLPDVVEPTESVGTLRPEVARA